MLKIGRKQTELSYEFSNKIEKKTPILNWNRIVSFVSTAERNINLI